jgi:hypothetical protein
MVRFQTGNALPPAGTAYFFDKNAFCGGKTAFPVFPDGTAGTVAEFHRTNFGADEMV